MPGLLFGRMTFVYPQWIARTVLDGDCWKIRQVVTGQLVQHSYVFDPRVDPWLFEEELSVEKYARWDKSAVKIEDDCGDLTVDIYPDIEKMNTLSRVVPPREVASRPPAEVPVIGEKTRVTRSIAAALAGGGGS